MAPQTVVFFSICFLFVDLLTPFQENLVFFPQFSTSSMNLINLSTGENKALALHQNRLLDIISLSRSVRVVRSPD